jgi:hypothetical protein
MKGEITKSFEFGLDAEVHANAMFQARTERY